MLCCVQRKLSWHVESIDRRVIVGVGVAMLILVIAGSCSGVVFLLDLVTGIVVDIVISCLVTDATLAAVGSVGSIDLLAPRVGTLPGR